MKFLAIALLASTAVFATEPKLNSMCKLLDKTLEGEYTAHVQVRMSDGESIMSDLPNEASIKRTGTGTFEYSDVGVETFNLELMNQGTGSNSKCLINFIGLDNTASLTQMTGTKTFTFQSTTYKESFLYLVRK